MTSSCRSWPWSAALGSAEPVTTDQHSSPEPTRKRAAEAAAARRHEIWGVVALALLGAVLRLVDLGSQGLWYDEVWTRDLANSPLALMLHRLPNWESTPPLYYLLVWFGRHVTGTSQFSLRLPGALAGIATVPAMWAAAREFGGRRAGLSAAALTACSPFMWWYSQEARAYSLAALFSAFALWFLARAIRTASGRDLFGWAAASALALLSQYPAGLVFAVSLIVLLVVLKESRRTVIAVSALPFAVGSALVPLALAQRSTGRSNWIELFPLRGRLEQLVSQFWLGNPAFSSGPQLEAAAAVGMLAVVALAIAARRANGELGLAVRVPAAIVVGSFALYAIAGAAGTDMIIARNLIVVWPAGMAVVAVCLGMIPKRLNVAFCVVVCSAMAALIVHVDTDPALQRSDWRPAAALLGPAPPGGRVIAVQAYPHSRPLTAYIPRLRRPLRAGDAVRELVMVSVEMPPPRWCWWGGVCADGILRSYSSVPIGARQFLGFKRVSIARSKPFTAVVYRAERPITVTTRSVERQLPSKLQGVVLYQR